MYNYNHLYYFYVTAKAGGVNAAAQHLRISQPSLKQSAKSFRAFARPAVVSESRP